ncbi:SWIRM-domain-containing protein [Phanerochaete sordida]|uniref:Transcriptional adapter 2 n=1 Tax=Phanerochaete sordida TaxID=48140 RepID=A0A9P3LCX7_9APHY|nr:SWIRM-domain-containing protein [Phanerochaete sordida]
MTVTHRKRQHQPEEIQTVNEPGLQINCDACQCDLTHSIRIICADPACEDNGTDICPSCFCAGAEFGPHKKTHAYRIVELHSYPIFTEDWGADEELLLLEGISLQGLGNWQAIAEHVGTRTREEVEQHYKSVYIDSPNWPLPRMDAHFDVDASEFHERKRRRIASMNTNPPPAPKMAPTSAPGVHEIAGFLPGRLEFEHEVENEAEDLVKDLEFGVCLEWGGDEIPEDEHDLDVKGRARMLEEAKHRESTPGKRLPNGAPNGMINGFHFPPAPPPKADSPPKHHKSDENKDENADEDAEEPTQPPPIETKESLTFKLTLLEMYRQRVEKRAEAKAVIFNRGLLNYKQMQANEKKRPKEEKDIAHRLRPFARLQTAEDYEAFVADAIWEAMLRKRIAELQHYRRMGLTNAADIEKYEVDLVKRTQARATISRDYYPVERLNLRTGSARQSAGPDSRRDSEGPDGVRAGPAPAAGPSGRKIPAPLNLANSPSLHLLTPEEQTLCSQLRILPKPYLVIKETLVREYARRGGKLRRREARDLVKIDVNKTSRVWDFLVQAGFLRVGAADPAAALAAHAHESRPSATPSISASPSKESTLKSPKPAFSHAPLGASLTPTPSFSSIPPGPSARPS